MNIDMEEMEEVIDFAKKAARALKEDEKLSFVTTSGFNQGSLIALRCGLLDDNVVVAKLDDEFTPINFRRLARKIEGDDGGVG